MSAIRCRLQRTTVLNTAQCIYMQKTLCMQHAEPGRTEDDTHTVFCIRPLVAATTALHKQRHHHRKLSGQ